MSYPVIIRKRKATLGLVLTLLALYQLNAAPAFAGKGVTDYLPAASSRPSPSTTSAPGAASGSPAQASAPLQGNVQTLSSGAGSSAPLQGGIKEQGTLNPSLQLTPKFKGRADANNGQGGSLKAMHPTYVPEQIRGSVHTGGTDGGISAGPVQFLGDTPRGGSPGMHGVIAPISSYQHTPASGVINYIPGSTTSFSSEGVVHTQDTLPKSYRTVGRGVVVFTPELCVMTGSRAIPMFAGSGGGGSAVLSTIQSNMVQMIMPTLSTGKVVWNCAGGGNDLHYLTRGGVTTAPGFEVTISPPGLSKETLGGRWSTNPTGTAEMTALAIPMQSQHIFNRIEPAAEIARAGVLAQFQAGKVDTWPQWYRAVAKAIYAHWQMVDVCPGNARLEVTIKPDHEISGQVVEFTPAADVERNVPRETEFRETAVKLVNGLSPFELPDYPDASSNPVTFDIDLKRTVDGPTGATVVGIPTK